MGVQARLRSFLTSILDVGGGYVHASATLSPGKERLVPVKGRIRGLHSRSERFGEEKHFILRAWCQNIFCSLEHQPHPPAVMKSDDLTTKTYCMSRV
jgi:hypothetical protein